VQSSTEVSTLTDDYSSIVTVSDKVLPTIEGTAVSQKVPSGDDHQADVWSRAEDEAAGCRNPSLSKPHLASEVDSEGACNLSSHAFWVHFVF